MAELTQDELEEKIGTLREEVDLLLSTTDYLAKNDLAYSPLMEEDVGGRQTLVHWIELPITAPAEGGTTYDDCEDIVTYSDAEAIFLQAAKNRDPLADPSDYDRKVSHGDIMVVGCRPCVWVCYVASVDRYDNAGSGVGYQIEDPTSGQLALSDEAGDPGFVRRELVIWNTDSSAAWCADFDTVGVDNVTSSSSAASLSTLVIGSPVAGSPVNVDHFAVSIGVPLGSFSVNSFDVTVGSASYNPSYEQTACCTDVEIGSPSLQSENTISLGSTDWVSLSSPVQAISDIDTRAYSSTSTNIEELVNSVGITVSNTTATNTSCSIYNPKFMDYSSVSLGNSLDTTLVKVGFACPDDYGYGANQCMTLEPVQEAVQTLEKHVINNIDAEFKDVSLRVDASVGYKELTSTTKNYDTQTKRLVIDTTEGKITTPNSGQLLKLSEKLVNLSVDSTPNTLKPYTQTIAFPNGLTNLFTNEKLSIKNRTRTPFTNTTTNLSGNNLSGNLVTSSFDITPKTVSLCKAPCGDATTNVTSGSASTVGGTSFVQASSSSYNVDVTTMQVGSPSSLGSDVSLHSMTVVQSVNSISSVVLDGLSVSLGVTSSSVLPIEFTEISLGVVESKDTLLDKLTASIANYGSSGSEAISSLAFASASSGASYDSSSFTTLECSSVSLGAVSIYGNKLELSDVLGTQEGKRGYIPYLSACPENGQIYVIEDDATIEVGGSYPFMDPVGFVSLGRADLCDFILSYEANIPVRRYDVDCGVLSDKDGATVNKTLEFNINTGLKATKMYEEEVTIGANTHKFLTLDAVGGTGSDNTPVGCVMTYSSGFAEDECCP